MGQNKTTKTGKLFVRRPLGVCGMLFLSAIGYRKDTRSDRRGRSGKRYNFSSMLGLAYIGTYLLA
jgi:hypothetical protein